MSVQADIDRLRTQRAAEWLEIMRGDHPELHAGFVSWITESPLNLDEFLKLDALSRETAAVLKAANIGRDFPWRDDASQVIQLKPDARATKIPARALPPRRTFWSAAAAMAAFAIAGGFWVHQYLSERTNYVTGKGEQRTVELNDGSMVYLNAESKLTVELGKSARTLRLSHGEALFDVAQDEKRPFRVWTKDAVVEALGTQFNVNAHEDGTRVAVIEGKVRVTREDDSDSNATLQANTALKAGETARVPRAGGIERNSSIDVAAVVSWSQPQLVFQGTPLEEAVKQFNRHRRSKRLRLEGVLPDTHHYTGLFNATDSEAFATLLSRERDLLVEHRDEEIVIRARSSALTQR